MRCNLTLMFACVVAAISFLAGPAWSQASAPNDEPRELHLAMHDALYTGDRPGQGDAGLLLWLSRDGEHWGRVWGMAGNFNRSQHTGIVTDSRTDGDALILSLQMRIGGDAWVPGGWALYEVTLTPTEGGGYDGRFSGVFERGILHPQSRVQRGEVSDEPHRIEGRVTGYWLPVQKDSRDGYEPVEPGEHPRLMFRKHDLPALRQRMNTPLGRAAMDRMTNAAGLAFKYQLTGNRDYAEQSRKLVIEHMADSDAGSKGVRARVWGWRLEQVALAYDMCHGAWEAEFRDEVEQYILRAANLILNNPNVLHSEINWHMAAHYPGTIYYGGAMAALAALGVQGPEPAQPEAPLAVRAPEAVVSPAADYTPGEGVPVVAFDSDEMPREWIYVGGFRPRNTDHLGAIGGVAAARPQVGTSVRFEDHTAEFKAMDARHLWSNERFTGGRTKLNITTAISREYHSKSYFFTVIRNDRPRWVQLRTDSGAAVYLNGVRLQENDFFRIEPGLYPMMVQIGIGETSPWGVIAMEPRLREVSEQEAQEGIKTIRGRHEKELAMWKVDHDEWSRNSGANVQMAKLFERTRMLMRLNYIQGIGAGGAQGTTDFPMGHEGPNKYAAAYRNVFGRDVSGLNDVTHYLPFKMFSRVYREDGEDLLQDINGEPDLFIRNVYHETRDLTGDFFAATFHLIPENWQPAALWFWNRHTGAQGPADADKLLHRPGRPYAYGDYDTHALWVYVNYPMNMTPRHPAELMPLTWSAPQFGHYGFRNRWDGDDGILVQIYAKAFSAGTGTRANAGTFRVAGLGEIWSHGTIRPGGFRFGENVVMVPQAEINENALGKIVHADTRSDGSGVVTIDLSDVYAGSSGEGSLYERYGSIRRPEGFAETGLSGLRAFGVDYSGKSGAPCVIVIVDKIDGVGKVEGVDKTLWAWQLDAGRVTVGRAQDVAEGTREEGVMWRGQKFTYRPGAVLLSGTEDLDREDCTVDGQRFRITSENGASLQGTFVEPGNVTMRFEERWMEIMRYKRNVSRVYSRALFAEGEGQYFVVLTLSKDGRHPEVRVEGEGLDARVRVGEQTIRFDGTKVVFE